MSETANINDVVTAMAGNATVDSPYFIGEPNTSDFDNVFLYRGDKEFIYRYKYCKTDPLAMYGRGIYLTVDPELASTYRSKTATRRTCYNNTTIMFFKILLPSLKIISIGRDNFRLGAAINLQIPSLNDDIKEVLDYEIKQEVGSRIDPYGIKLVKPWKPWKRKTSEHKQIILNALKNISYRVCSYYALDSSSIYARVLIDDLPCFGRVTVFKFNRKYLYEKTTDFDSFSMMIYQFQLDSNHSLNWVHKNLLLQQGIIGLRYMGGNIIGKKNHQCFVLWDEDFVNHHKIRSVK